MPKHLENVTLVEWEERPYTAHDKSHIVREHRISVDTFGFGGLDIKHQIRENNGELPGEWDTAEVWEYRNGRIEDIDMMEHM